MLNSIKIEGLRGFSKEQTLIFSKPNGKKGSGLTTLVGINNSGKTTIIEAIKYYNCDVNNISFSQGKRNIKCDGKVSIEYTDFDGNNYILKTKESGGSQVKFRIVNIKLMVQKCHLFYQVEDMLTMRVMVIFIKVIDMNMLIMKYIVLKLGNQ